MFIFVLKLERIWKNKTLSTQKFDFEKLKVLQKSILNDSFHIKYNNLGVL